MRRMMMGLVGAALLAGPAAAATQVVVNFDDLGSAGGIVSNSYGGINWNNDFGYYDPTTQQYQAHSGATVAYSNYATHSPGSLGYLTFNFLDAAQFNGAFFSGDAIAIGYELFRNGQLVAATSAISGPTPWFLASGYDGLVDEVRVYGQHGSFVMDDVTYTTNLTAGVPEPGVWTMMIIGFGLLGEGLRRQRRLGLAASAA